MTNSIHDMGGMHGFGEIRSELKEPVFHHHWEGRVAGLMLSSLGVFQVTLDNVRSRMEHIPPAVYLESGYYEKWLMTLEELVLEKGILNRAELAALALGQGIPLTKDVEPIPAADLLAFMSVGATAARQIEAPANFKVGDRVRVKNINPDGHTRMPRYVRGRQGVVIADCGGQIYPEVSAKLEGDGPERLYTLQFKATTLWGDDANPNDTLCIDLWEPYLETIS